jgi:prefoldin subunit 5
VTDARLAGITEVTAAHEMLHQAFDRLSTSDKKRVSDMLNSYYKNGLTDKNIIDKMASYKKLEPNDMVNEMHSVFGTEVGKLPADLETYYKQYFTDRSKIVAYRDQYVSAFSQRQQQIEDYDKQRDELKLRIDQAQNDLDSWETKLKATRDTMNQWLAASEIDRYNAAVPSFNAQVAAYKAKVVDTNNLIDEYNTITDKRNALTAQEQELLQAQDSHASSASAE